MLDTNLLIIFLQSWGWWPTSHGGPGGAHQFQQSIARMTGEEMAEISRVLNNFSEVIGTPEAPPAELGRDE